ncbi:MAG: hypothetical protein IPJ80_05845 [Saprospiraceae bacterium]|nr:hypothetical protein [Saprospiraceae bacterium]
MNYSIYKLLFLVLVLAFAANSISSCNQIGMKEGFAFKLLTLSKSQLPESDLENCCNLGVKSKVLMSTRFKNLDHLKTVVSIKYDKDYLAMDSMECIHSVVNISYTSNGETIARSMSSGVSQNEILKLQKADFLSRTRFVLSNPTTIRQRDELDDIYMLSRRRPAFFGPGDMSFYDLAEESFRHINTPNLAYKTVRDSSEKGFINTFNHVTAQAIITSFFSEELADLIADLHERNNMPEITSGKFSMHQLKDSINSPEDNYIDIINNEIGQKLGYKLKEKYNLNENTVCTPDLLTAYLNDLQGYYMWALEIGMDNFRSKDDMVIKFANKINVLLNRS